MIYFTEKNTAGIIFGHGTVEMSIGANDKMDNAPYLVLNGWSEPQPIKEYDPNDEVTGEATPERIYLQFDNLKGLDALERSLKEVRKMFEVKNAAI